MVKISILILSILIISIGLINYNKTGNYVITKFDKEIINTKKINSSNSLIMYECIEKYSKEYNVPKYVAFNVAFKETRYRGPFHQKYKHIQKSYAGALGPMQIMLATARSPVFSRGEGNITAERLMNDIDLNVRLSMKILRRNFEKTGSWKLACGKYNTGKAIVNDYAIYCSSNKNYKSKWIKY